MEVLPRWRKWMQANYKTNVVGGLLTGVVTYNITLQTEYDNTENKEIE